MESSFGEGMNTEMKTLILKWIKQINWRIAFVVFSLLTLTIGQFSPIEITLPGLSFVFYSVIMIEFPILAVKELRKLFSKIKNDFLVALLKVIVVFALLFYVFYVFAFCFGNVLCGNIADQTLFTKKNSSSAKIIARHYDCGALDSQMPNYEIVKVIDVFSIFNIVTTVDTAKIDKTVWLKVASKN